VQVVGLVVWLPDDYDRAHYGKVTLRLVNREIKAVQIRALDHIVLTVGDVVKSCEFYNRILGLDIFTFGDNRKSLIFGNQKINLHESGREFLPCAARPTPGSADICLIAETPVDEIITRLQQYDVAVELGPVERTGAMGPLVSIYIRDPDQNLIELSNLLQDLQ